MYYNLGFLLVCMLRLLVQETHTDRRFNCFREWQWWRIGEALQPWTWIFLPHQAPNPGATPVSAEGPEIPAQSWYLHKALPSAISGQAMQHLIPCWILVTDSLFGFFFSSTDEGKYLEGEKRISFLMEKIQEIRKIYMNLKSEVACIDRRRKRAKRRDRDRESKDLFLWISDEEKLGLVDSAS